MSEGTATTELKRLAMQSLQESGLDQVCDTAYALDPIFTPNYSAMAIELPALAGYQLRVVGDMISIETVAYQASDVDVHAHTRRALRTLMQRMRAQAEKWLDANPE